MPFRPVSRSCRSGSVASPAPRTWLVIPLIPSAPFRTTRWSIPRYASTAARTVSGSFSTSACWITACWFPVQRFRARLDALRASLRGIQALSRCLRSRAATRSTRRSAAFARELDAEVGEEHDHAREGDERADDDPRMAALTNRLDEAAAEQDEDRGRHADGDHDHRRHHDDALPAGGFGDENVHYDEHGA